jgi:hypothetical protein
MPQATRDREIDRDVIGRVTLRKNRELKDPIKKVRVKVL